MDYAELCKYEFMGIGVYLGLGTMLVVMVILIVTKSPYELKKEWKKYRASRPEDQSDYTVMKKRLDTIAIYLPVAIVCVLIGTIGRLKLMLKGVEEYTANVFFWMWIGVGILTFVTIRLFLYVVWHTIQSRFFRQKDEPSFHKRSKSIEDDTISNNK